MEDKLKSESSFASEATLGSSFLHPNSEITHDLILSETV
jgi:hypothetical protein